MHFGYKYVPKLVHFLHHLLYYHQSNLASEQLCVSSSTNMSLLTMGQEHRGTIANIATYDVTRFRTRAGKMIAPDPLIVDYVKRAGFGEVMNLTHTSVDMKFILALCERWRPETHTFHLPMGECTVTLEDVYMLLGLRTNGKAVYGNVQQPNALCVELLGVDLIEGEGQQRGRGQGIKLAGLQEAYVGIQLDQFSDEETILRKTRMYIMLLFGRFLFPEGTGNSVNFMYLCLLGDIDAIKTYSWGSAVLAYLYSSLCKCAKKDVCTFSGCAFLLQTWAWYKIQIKVVHSGTRCKFFLWDQEWEQLLGLSAAQLRSTMSEDEVTDPLEFPLALDKLLGSKIAFKVKWHPL
ncbi:protein MAIN-LIKE 2-like [Vicia villosa]|uniref:protein MAIN-LIKE 2-like n=1 Tax=Vicia villosa TaxID=3911 RepID=UPI00273CCA4C|nr:protein MAIN-LIKE 2-like [Vicia villosa]